MTITRLWQSGAESGSVNELPVVSGMSVVSDNKYTGTYSYYCLGAGQYGRVTIPATKQIRTGCFHYYAGGGQTNKRIVIATGGGSYLVALQFVSNTDIHLYIGASLEDTAVGESEGSSWYHIGVDVKIDAIAGWAKVYKDGVEILSFEGNTGSSDIEQIRWGRVDGGGAYDHYYYDDLYVDDSTGEGSPSPLKLKRFYWLNPNDNGNYSQWTPSSGSGYECVDERPPSDSDYIQSDAAGELESHGMSSYTIGATEQCAAIIPVVRAAKAGTNEKIKIGTRLSSTDLLGSEQDLPSSADYFWERQTSKPGGGAWEQADIDAFEILLQSAGSY